VNDAYNANPASMVAALRALGSMRPGQAGRRWAVLGQMAELGPGSADEHARVGRLAAELGIDGLVVVGPQAGVIGDATAAARPGAGPEVYRAADVEAAVALVRRRLRPGDIVLVKASRAARLERVAHALTEARPVVSGGGD
jgi:UDP-N-acetylmuramoyl-tripeptide--D-alanyl-D-alanine ligase